MVDNVLGLYRDDQGDKQWNSGDKRDYYYDYHNAEIKDDNGEEHCIRIINMYHPSARISNEDYINKFKERYGDSEEAKNSSESLYWSKKDIYKIIENMDENSEEYAELCDLINNIDAVQKKKEL